MWRSLPPSVRHLLIARALRSLAQGALIVDLTLYLDALGWSGLAIGGTLAASGLFAALLGLIVGPASDRYGYRRFLVGYEVLTLACSLIVLLSTQVWVLAGVILLAGFGRGRSGTAGPFAPAEQAWLAEFIPENQRGFIYSLNLSLGFWGMAIGALLAALPAFWVATLGVRLAFAPIFLLALVCALANILLLRRTEEQPHPPTSQALRAEDRQSPAHRFENQLFWKLFQINSLNGLSMGLVSPLISYWFAQRFDLGPAHIGPIMALTFVAAGVASLVTGHWGDRHGLIRAVVWSRSLGVIMLVLLPLAPWFWLAALFDTLRMASNGASAGSRQAQVINLVRHQRRAQASSINAASFQLPQALGPALAGPLIAADLFATPFYLAALLQVAYIVGYRRVFRRFLRLRPSGD